MPARLAGNCIILHQVPILAHAVISRLAQQGPDFQNFSLPLQKPALGLKFTPSACQANTALTSGAHPQ